MFCPTSDRRGARAELRRRSARRGRDAAGERRRAVPDDRDDARLRRQQERLRGHVHSGQLQQPLLRAAGLRGGQLLGARIRPLVRQAGLAHEPGLRRRLDPSHGPPLRVARHAAPARPAGGPGRGEGGRPRRDRRLLRRHPEPQPGAAARPHPAARRLLPALEEPERHAAQDRRGLRALARLGPHLRASAERPLPRLPHPEAEPEHHAGRRDEEELQRRALLQRQRHRLLRPHGRRLQLRHHDLEGARRPRRARPRGRPRRGQGAHGLPQLGRPHRPERGAARAERLDGRSLPSPRGAARVPHLPGRARRAHLASARGPRASPRHERSGQNSAMERQGSDFFAAYLKRRARRPPTAACSPTPRPARASRRAAAASGRRTGSACTRGPRRCATAGRCG